MNQKYFDLKFGIVLNHLFRYPRLYRPLEKLPNGSMLRLLPFCDEQSIRRQFEMRLENNLLEFGPIHRLNLMKLANVHKAMEKLPCSYQRLSEVFPCADSDTDTIKNFAKLGVSSDENAEKLTNVYLPGLFFFFFCVHETFFTNVRQLYFILKQCN